MAHLNCPLTVNRGPPPLLAIESPFPEARSVLRLLEAHDICQKSLWERLFDGTYEPLEVINPTKEQNPCSL